RVERAHLGFRDVALRLEAVGLALDDLGLLAQVGGGVGAAASFRGRDLGARRLDAKLLGAFLGVEVPSLDLAKGLLLDLLGAPSFGEVLGEPGDLGLVAGDLTLATGLIRGEALSFVMGLHVEARSVGFSLLAAALILVGAPQLLAQLGRP